MHLQRVNKSSIRADSDLYILAHMLLFFSPLFSEPALGRNTYAKNRKEEENYNENNNKGSQANAQFKWRCGNLKWH